MLWCELKCFGYFTQFTSQVQFSIDGDILLNESGGNGPKLYRNEEREVITVQNQTKIAISKKGIPQTRIQTRLCVLVNVVGCQAKRNIL